MRMRTLLLFPFALALGACAQISEMTRSATSPPEAPMAVEVHVHGLRADEQEQLRAQLCALTGVTACTKAGDDGYALTYAGSLTSLKNAIADFQHPGLQAEQVKAQMSFRGYDNQAPAVDVLSPKADAVLTDPKVDVVIQVPDPDTASVRVGERPAEKVRAGVYQVHLVLTEGENNFEVTAVDEAHNKATVPLHLVLDTTPPDVTAAVKVVVEGKVERGSTVFVDGQPVTVDLLGNWRAEVVVKRGQKTVEIIAVE